MMRPPEHVHPSPLEGSDGAAERRHDRALRRILAIVIVATVAVDVPLLIVRASGSPKSPTASAVKVAADARSTTSPPPRSRREQPTIDARTVRPDAPRTCGREGARMIRFRVEVQENLREGRLAETPAHFAAAALRILCDDRSWIASGRVAFSHDPDARLVLRLLDAASTERRCFQLTGLSVAATYSCASRGRAEVVLNANRWFFGSKTWPGSVADYRHLLLNHEVGHILGEGHVGCGAAGSRAPVMMQQSKGTDGCIPNAWPTRTELARVARRYSR